LLSLCLSCRPIEWSDASVIFTAHPTQPLITARHFSTLKKFFVPSPTPVVSSSASYEPPSIISVAPGYCWLFAYFPRRDGDGIACLWERAVEIDNWRIKEWWSLAQGAGIVSANWIGAPRQVRVMTDLKLSSSSASPPQWITDSSGSSTRLPPRGPHTPVSSPTLLLVTQDHRVNVCYFRHYIPSLKILSCSLEQPGVILESQAHLVQDKSSNAARQCFCATIGLGYNGERFPSFKVAAVLICCI